MHYTKDSYLRKTKEIVDYFEKPMNQVTTKEIRKYYKMYQPKHPKGYLFLNNVKGYTSTNDNMKAVAYMLDTDVWSVYKGDKAEYAIGGPM